MERSEHADQELGSEVPGEGAADAETPVIAEQIDEKIAREAARLTAKRRELVDMLYEGALPDPDSEAFDPGHPTKPI